jgi:hypothetical protein
MEPIVNNSSITTAGGVPSMLRADRKVIYINLIVLDASDAIESMLSRSLDAKHIPKPLQSIATKLVTKLATPEKVAEVLATELPKKLVTKTANKGLTAVAEVAFQEGPYIVLHLQLQQADTKVMIQAQTTDDYDEDDGSLEQSATLSKDGAARILSCLQHFWSWLGGHRQRSLEEDYLPKLIQARMEDLMGEVLADKLEQKGLEAISEVLPEEQQARYFFETLRQVRATKEEGRPLRKFQSRAATFQLGKPRLPSLKKEKKIV